MVETYDIPQGKLRITMSDKNMSIGFLELNPGQELEKHNRPVDEELVQIKGKSVIRIYKNELVTKKTLIEKKGLLIPARQMHVHSNPFDEKSVTLWKFKGDITKILDKIRKSNHS